jgi:prepilin-type N-terminal cleavage/methylation domain-containing protein
MKPVRQTSSRVHRRDTLRQGITLVEMLLVLAILGVMAAISYPNLQRFMSDQKIKEATEMVRKHLAGTRNKAIDAVLIYEFRYEPGGNRFLVIPHEQDQAPTSTVNPQGQVASGDGLYRFAGVLRPGVQFAVPKVELTDLGIPVVETPVPVADWQIQGLMLPDGGELGGAKWSDPILFYPDGSAAQSMFRLEDEAGKIMEITVRGLTGSVSAGPVAEEVQL